MKNNNSKPVLAIIGRPNVGKSTLFNRLTKKWQAIVEDRPGITRDRLYGECQIADHGVIVMDTGGLQFDASTTVEQKMSDQAFSAIDDADLILFVMDGRAGVTPVDRDWIQKIRRIKKPKLFLVNKLDQPQLDAKAQEFFELGVEPLIPISFEFQRNFSELYEKISATLNENNFASTNDQQPEISDISIAICGRPNVGKSTLLNSLLDSERCIVDDVPGTTRDPIHSYLTNNGKVYKFIDTAGIRKRAKTSYL